MAKILVVDDVEKMRSALRDILNKHGHQVTEASNGKTAMDLLKLNEYELVITDIQMPNMTGIELLKWVKENRSMPVILMTGFSHILETHEASEMGADDFLTKPIRYNDILQSVGKVLGIKPKPADAEVDLDSQFCRIPIEDFISTSHLNASIYVRLSNTKYIRVSHKGDTIPQDRVDNYKQKGLAYLYTTKEDFANVVGFNLYLSKALLTNKTIPMQKKTAFLRYSTETVLENIHVNGVNEQSFEYAKESVGNFLNLIAESATLFQLLEALNEHATWIYAHSMGVSVYGAMIAKQIGWSSKPLLFKITLSGLMHDIGKKEIDPDVLVKPRFQLNRDERALYETHPTRGRAILESVKEIPDDIVQVAHQHHEDCTGKGFPQRIGKHRIHPLAKVIGLADQFVCHALRSPFCDGASAQEALEKIREVEMQFDPQAFQALEKLCTV